MIASRAGGGLSKLALRAANVEDFATDNFAESELINFGKIFRFIGGGVERFLALGFSKLAANALKAGDLPLTRTLSGLKDMLLDRCDLSGTADLPPYATGLLFGF